MAQNLTIAGASYSDVPALVCPKTGGGTATFTDTSPTTAAAADVASGKYFFDALGQLQTGTASGGGGGASNLVTGTFKGTTTGAAMDVTLNYSGSGYPIVVVIYPSDGVYNNGGTYYNLLQRYATNYCVVIKDEIGTTPDYSENSSKNRAGGYQNYKNSATNWTNYSGTLFPPNSNLAYNDISATSTNSGIIKIRSKTKLSVYIADSSYGFAANIEYTYHVIYSS